MRFLHCADVHLGGANAAERLRAFQRMLDFCTRQDVQLLLIAGDLFDVPRAEPALRKKVYALLQEHAELSVLIAAGNHDPVVPGGNYDGELPENVYVFGSKWSSVRIAELNVRVWGASFDGEGALPFCPQMRRERNAGGEYELGVLHGDIVSKNARSDYRAVTQEAIADTGLGYLALGHIHKRSDIARAGQTYYAYSGCMQGAGFDETGEMGAYLGEVGEDGLEISFVRLCGSVYEEMTLEVTTCSDLQDIAKACRERIGDRTCDHIRVTLVGDAMQTVDAEALERLLEDAAAEVRIEDETHAAADYESLAAENTLRGAFVRRMLSKIREKEARGEDTSVEKMALHYGAAAFEGEVRAIDH